MSSNGFHLNILILITLTLPVIEPNVVIPSIFEYIYPNYAFWDLGNNHEMSVGTHCTICVLVLE